MRTFVWIEGKSHINILQEKTLKGESYPTGNKDPPTKYMKTITYYFKTSKRTKKIIEK